MPYIGQVTYLNLTTKIKLLKRDGHINDSKIINKNDIMLDVILYPKKY